MSGLSGIQAESWVRAAFQTLPDLITLPICIYLSALHLLLKGPKRNTGCSGLGWGGEKRDEEEGEGIQTPAALSAEECRLCL